jgi:uncharacterized protein
MRAKPLIRRIRRFDTCLGQIYDARLMVGGWSSAIDPIHLADIGARLSGEFSIKGLARLVEMCRNEDGSAQFDLRFERSPGDGLRTMLGAIAAQINVSCQRCMNDMSISLKCRPRLLLLRPGERDDLLESGNAFLVDRPIPLGTLIEDELLLAMPMIPMHPLEDCPSRDLVQPGARRKSDLSANNQANPFSVLTSLKEDSGR